MAFKDRKNRALWLTDRRLVSAGGFDPTMSLYAFEDFIGDHLAEDSTVVVNQSGTPTTPAAVNATAGAPTAGQGGWIAGSVDNVDDEIDEVALGAKPWHVPAALGTGELIVAEIAFVVPSALTAQMYFAGLGDAAILMLIGTNINMSIHIPVKIGVKNCKIMGYPRLFRQCSKHTEAYEHTM